MEFILQIACKVTPTAEEWEPFFKIAEKAATILWKQEFQRIRRSNEDILSAIGYYWKDWDSDVLCRFRDGILQGKSEEYYKTALKELRTAKKKEREKRIKRKINEQRLLPWVFFLLQIVLGIMVLT